MVATGTDVFQGSKAAIEQNRSARGVRQEREVRVTEAPSGQGKRRPAENE